MRRRDLLRWGGCGMGLVAVIAVGTVVATTVLPLKRCTSVAIAPVSSQIQTDRLEPWGCELQQGLVDADHRYWTTSSKIDERPASSDDPLGVNCLDGGMLEVPSGASPAAISYAVRLQVAVHLIPASGAGLPTPASSTVMVGATTPDLCSGVPDGAVSNPRLADFDARLWTIPSGADPDVPIQFTCGSDGLITKTPSGPLWLVTVLRKVVLVRTGGPSATPPASFHFRPVPCGSSADGVVLDGAVWHLEAGSTFPAGKAPDCMRNGSMLLDRYGRLHLYAPDGRSVTLRAYTGPEPVTGCE